MEPEASVTTSVSTSSNSLHAAAVSAVSGAIYFPVPQFDHAAPLASTSALLEFPPKQPRALLTGSHDLLSHFGLEEAYDDFVRPYRPPILPAAKEVRERSISPRKNDIKGKSKAVEYGGPALLNGDVDMTGEASSPAAAGDSKGERKTRKMNKHYTHLVEDLQGKYSLAKDDYLTMLVQHPDYQPAHIEPFDDQTLSHGFTLQPGAVENWEAIVAGPQPESKKEKKKRKKKRPRDSVDLRHAQQQNGVQASPAPAAAGGAAGTPATVASTVNLEPSKKRRKKG